MDIIQMQEKKMVVFDMDNTLIQNRFIDVCAEHYNFKYALELLRQIDTDPVSLTKRIAVFLKGKKVSELIKIISTIPLVTDVHDVVAELKLRGYRIGIISDSYQVVTGFVCNAIKADFHFSNDLQHNNGVITGDISIAHYFIRCNDSTCNHVICKTNALRYACEKYDVAIENCIGVGDSENDMCMIQHAGIGVAFCTTSHLLKNIANKNITSPAFSQLLEYAH